MGWIQFILPNPFHFPFFNYKIYSAFEVSTSVFRRGIKKSVVFVTVPGFMHFTSIYNRSIYH